ncbi:hypothetical protein SynA1562_00816 [Synechococcus sp. A15-62]|nr:hypothetical protein SynA1562_00816 [Synechococcus sp. A15-62]
MAVLVIRANENSMPKDDRIHIICFDEDVASLAVITAGSLLWGWAIDCWWRQA